MFKSTFLVWTLWIFVSFLTCLNLLLEYLQEFKIEYSELDLGLNLKILCVYHDREVLEKGKLSSGSYKLQQIIQYISNKFCKYFFGNF